MLYSDKKVTVFSGKDTGRKRNKNQDELILLNDIGFFAVSDGMGGMPCGGEASEMVRELFTELIRINTSELLNKSQFTAESAANLLVDTTREVCQRIVDDTGEFGQMKYGATLCGVWFVGSKAVFVNIGDSRGYIVRDGYIRQITTDHNLAAQMVAEGMISKEEAVNHKAASRITRFIGANSVRDADSFIEAVGEGDIVLLCSDGLYGEVAEKEILDLVYDENPSQELILAANTNGGRDNISVVVIRISDISNKNGINKTINIKQMNEVDA